MVEVYNSFAKVPLDVPGIDHDDRLPVLTRVTQARGLYAVKAPVPSSYGIVVPFPGVYHEGDRSPVVYGLKRIVHRMTGTLPVLWGAPDTQKRFWGEYFTEKLERAQRRAGLDVTGMWDVATHDRFAPWADQYAISLIQPQPITPEEKQRVAVLSFLMAFYNRRWAIDYNQIRPTQLKKVRSITRADCSGSVAEGMWTADVMPKVDWRWTNTDLQIRLGSGVFKLDQVRIGDVAFYGDHSDMNPSHESCIVDTGTKGHDVRVFSFGHYPAKILPIDYRTDRIAIRRFIP